MIIYEFFNIGGKISREEIEVTEKQNVYEVNGSNGKKRIKKSAINVLREGFASLSMYSLVENPEYFIRQVITHKKATISDLEVSLATLKNEIISLHSVFGNYVSDNVWHGQYHPRGELIFFMGEDKHVTGKPIENDNVAAEELFVLVDGNTFISAVEKYDIVPEHTVVHMIYVNGKRTNLVLDGYETYCINGCVISLEKFISLCNKFRVEVNYELRG